MHIETKEFKIVLTVEESHAIKKELYDLVREVRPGEGYLNLVFKDYPALLNLYSTLPSKEG
jgi:hypothetical protein